MTIPNSTNKLFSFHVRPNATKIQVQLKSYDSLQRSSINIKLISKLAFHAKPYKPNKMRSRLNQNELVHCHIRRRIYSFLIAFSKQSIRGMNLLLYDYMYCLIVKQRFYMTTCCPISRLTTLEYASISFMFLLFPFVCTFVWPSIKFLSSFDTCNY